MRQVPSYLIIGNGRIARHFAHYFSLVNLPYFTWHRPQTLDELSEKTALATHILLLIKDDVIEPFIDTHLKDTTAVLIHCSGSLVTDKAYGAHPLMTFSLSLYELALYKTIPFIIDDDAPQFATLLPGLSNAHFRLAKSLKAKYHALCVLGGNLSCILWQKVLSTFETELHFPPDIAHAYLQQQTQNLVINYKTALTGPIARNDQKTIERNLSALDNDPFQKVYESFVIAYEQLKYMESL